MSKIFNLFILLGKMESLALILLNSDLHSINIVNQMSIYMISINLLIHGIKKLLVSKKDGNVQMAIQKKKIRLIILRLMLRWILYPEETLKELIVLYWIMLKIVQWTKLKAAYQQMIITQQHSKFISLDSLKQEDNYSILFWKLVNQLNFTIIINKLQNHQMIQ